MVHRPPDARLLNNLITHEKEYTKHLVALFPLSHTALASLSAYGSASPSANPYSAMSGSPAQVVAAIVDVLAGAEDALQRYLQVVEKWREQLVSLKELEEDVGAIIHDREILVTRVIKLSRSPKAARDARSSVVLNPRGSSSFSSLPSTSSTITGPAGSKLAQAQVELQACERQLAEKERELAVRRVSVLREGLGARCRALIDCGWIWGEMGKQGLRALQSLTTDTVDPHKPGVTFPRTHSPPPSHGYQSLDPSSANTPPGPTSYSSDISSLTPSQSISQRAGASIEAEPIREPSDSPIATRKPEDEIFYQGHVTISLPPAHAISELELPTGVRTPPPTSTPASTSTPVPTPLHAVPNGNDVDSKQNPCIPGTGPRRARSQQRRPVSTRISEVSNEDAHQDEERTNVPSSSPPIRSTSFRNNSSTVVAGGIATRRSESSDDDLEGPLEVVENDPFASIRSKSILLRVPPDTDGGHSEIPSPGLAKSKPRERKVSSTFLGSLRGLFRTRGRTKGMDSPSAVWEGPVVAEPRSPKGTNGWVTRIDGHLRTRRDSSDSEGGAGNRRESGARSKLRKGRGSPTNAASPWGKNISSGSTPTRANTSGWLTDSGGGQGVVRGKSKRRKKSIAALKGPEAGFTDGEVEHEVERGKGRHSMDVYPPTHTNVAQRDKASQARPQLAPSPSLTKGVAPSGAEEAANARAKRNRRATADLSNMGSNGNMLDTGLQAPRSRRSSTILSSPSETSPQTSAKSPSQQIPQQLQPGSTSGTPKGRLGAKPGILHTPNGSADQSLMSIVEDVARQNRERRLMSTQAVSNGHDNLTGRELPTLELPRAPSLRAPQATVPGISTHDGWFGRLPNGSTRSLDVPHTRSAASPSLPASLATAITSKVHDGSMSDTATPARTVTSSTHLSRPAKSPFPSALRNVSRTPSPNPVPVTKSTGAVWEAGINTQSLNGAIAEPDQPRGRPLERVLVANRMSLTYDPRDSMSISSYETGRESPMSSSPSPSPLPQPLSLLPQSSSQTPTARSPPSRDHDQTGTSSTASGDTPTTRRKSVRVSLQPTFSPAPPAEYDQFDEDETGGRHVSWSSRSKRVSGAATHDVWQDSSEEDEEYRRARQLLSRAGKRNGKA